MTKSWTPIRPTPLRFLGGVTALLLLGLLALPHGAPPPSDHSEAVAACYSDSDPWSTSQNWTVVADFTTPWGQETRLRPVCGTMEVRGADLRITTPLPSSTRTQNLSSANRSSAITFFTPRTGRGGSGFMPIDQGRQFVKPEAILSPELWKQIEDWAQAEKQRTRRSSIAIEQTFVSIQNGVPEFRALGTLPPGQLPWSSLASDWTDCAIEVELLLDPRDGSVLEVRDARLRAVGSAQVFDPNPIASTGRTDLRDGDPTANFRTRVDLPRLDGEGRLRGRYIQVFSDREPRANSPDLVFDYLPYDPRFEEAMAYYHGDRSLETARTRGFEGLFPVPLKVRVHGTQLDNSWYSRRTREIVFGDGGVDDAEDGDIILHESAHAIHDALAPGFEGLDMFAISEGFSDFWAASLTGDACVGDWDATSYSPPCLRTTDNSAIFPQDITASPHRNGLIFGGLFWDLRAALGAEDSERLALATLVELGPRGEWMDVGAAVLSAAVQLNLETNSISRILVGRGLLRQTLVTEIELGEPLVLDLVVPALCLGERVTALSLRQDGTLEWSSPTPIGSVAARAEVTPIRQGGADEPLRVHIVAGSDGVRITQSWLDPTGEWMRVQTDWDGARGTVAWTYLQLPDDATEIALSIGQGVTPTFPTPIDMGGSWNHLSAEGGFTGTLGAEPYRLVGSRFQAGIADGQTWLDRHTPLRSLPWTGLQLSVLPNPISESSEVRLYLEEPGPVAIAIFGADGRALRRVAAGNWFPAGLSRIPLPLLDGQGKSLPLGHYWVRADSEGRTATTSFVRTP